jgi:hypothetical protein
VDIAQVTELDQAAWANLTSPSVPLICPLTLDLPDWLSFPAKAVFDACRQVDELQGVVSRWGVSTGKGTYWLPIVLTARGPLYAEAIGPSEPGTALPASQAAANGYIQPIHLLDSQRQPLYALGYQLLRTLEAPPAVYFIQFGWRDSEVWFDRLIPFPPIPAIASLGTQTPDLLTCHWRCLTNQPIRELTVSLART